MSIKYRHCQKGRVTKLTLPPHCSHKLQLLDLRIFGPINAYYNTAVDSCLIRNTGVPITIYQAAECIGEAHIRAMTVAKIMEVFQRSGIFPYNIHIFEESDFLTSAVTYCPQETASLASSSSSRTEKNISVSEPAPSNIQLDASLSEYTKEKSISTYISPE
jgi:hypothetical protein